MSFVSTLSDQQQQVARWLPYPIASAWHEVLVARGVAQIEQRVLATTEVVARMLGVIALCDYLRGPPEPTVEACLQRLEQPQPADWLALVDAAVRAAMARGEPRPFAPELARWAVDSHGAAGHGIERLRRAVAMREEHLLDTMTDVTFDHGARVEVLGRTLLEALESLDWLGLYRLLRVAELTTTRHSGFFGRVQLFVGGAQSPVAMEAAWTAHLLADVVYLVNARASEVLEISPFVRVLPHPKTRRPVCFLFESSRGLKRLQLASDANGVTVETAISGPDGEMALAAWLQVRGEHGAWMANSDPDGVLAAAPNVVQQRPGRAKSRPIPDLSTAAFRPLRPRIDTNAWSEPRQHGRLVLAAQIAAVIALSVVSVKLLGPRLRQHGATVAADAPESVVGPQRRPERPPTPTPAAVVAALVPPPAPVAQPIPQPAPVVVAAPPPQPAPVPVAAQVPPPEAVAPPAPVVPPTPVVPPAPVPAAPPPAPVAPAPRRDGNTDFLGRGQALVALRPTYALLQWQQALEAGDDRAHAALARLYAQLGQNGKCRPHALLALRAAPGELAMQELAQRCGATAGEHAVDAPPTPAERLGLTSRLYQEATTIIYGARHKPAERREMAKDLYADAAHRGLAKAWLGLAKIHLLGELDRAGCRRDLAAYAAAGGDMNVPEARMLAAKLAK